MPHNRPRRLLIIEDNLVCQRLYRAALSELCYHLELVTTAAQALDCLAQHAYACILLDLGLPDRAGNELIPLIRSNPLHHSTPIIVISAHADQLLQQQYLDLGANEVCSKPISSNEIQQIIKNYSD
jgi:CheY-like chemotaxis protein